MGEGSWKVLWERDSGEYDIVESKVVTIDSYHEELRGWSNTWETPVLYIS